MDDSENPYAAPATEVTLAEQDLSSLSDAKQIRNAFFKHERAVKSISVLYIFGCFFVAIYLIALMFLAYSDPQARPYALIGMVVLLLLIWFFAWIARGLRRLDPRIRIPVTLLSVIGLLGVPLGTILSAYILYLIYCEKGKYVFSPEYAAIVVRTPHIRPRISIIVWILLVLLGVLILMGFVGMVASVLLGG